MTDVDYLKAAIKALPPEATLAQITEYVEAKKKLDQISSGEKPEGEEDAPEAPAMSRTEAPETVVQASTEAAEFADPAMDVEAAEGAIEGEAMAAIGVLAEAAGMAPEEAIAALRDKAADVAAVLKGAGAGQPEVPPAMSRAAKDALRASKARIEALELSVKQRDQKHADLEKQIAELRSQGDERTVDDAIRLGRILPAHKPLFLALARSDRKEFEAQLASAAKAPALVTEDLATGKGSGATPDNVTPDANDPRLLHLERSLKNAGVSPARIKAELAKARAKDFEGRA